MKPSTQWSSLSLIALTSLGSHCSSARETGQHAVDQNRATLAAQNSGGSTSANAIVIAASGSSTPVSRPVTMGRDEAPTLTTVRGRNSQPNQATISGPSAVDVSRVPGVVPPSGGFVVRRAGAGTAGSAAVATAPTSTSGSASTPRETTVHFEHDSVDGALVRPEGERRVLSRSGGEESGGLGLRGSGSGMSSTTGVTASAPSHHGVEAGRRAPAAEMRAQPAAQAAPANMRDPGAGMRADDRAVATTSSEVMAAPPTGGPVGAMRIMSPTPVGMGARPVPMTTPPNSTITVTTTVAVTPPVVVAVDEQQMSAGLLTAASVGDADRFGNYLEYLSRHEMERGELNLDMSRRLRVRVVDAGGRGVSAAHIRIGSQIGTVEGLTHADGSFDFFPNVSMPGLQGPAQLNVQVESLSVNAEVQVPPFGDGQAVVVRLPANIVPPSPVLDLGFLIDVTGSMGDELRYVNREIASIVHRVEQESPGVRVRLSATFYRDRSDELVVQQIPFTTNVAGFAVAMQNVFASGGGDYPEDMNAGLDAAMNRLAWSDGAAVRVLVLVADAPPQHYADEQFTYREAMARASQRGIRLLPVAASGSDRRVEYLFRAMGAYTSTPYVYLTDDSGVGGPHMEADTDRVAVERFNDALVRLITSDLRGQGMHEPGRLASDTQ